MYDDVILLTERDYLRIRHILSTQNSDDFENLEIEIERAKIIEEKEIPSDLVRMNTTVRFMTLQDEKEMKLTLVFPEDANFSEGKISILAPLGSALIGLRVNQEINWMFPDGKTKTIKILEVL
ncbi:nucleoside diphosphate kinase regulator [Bacteriovorax sp. PP10]|uniref:Nucleoside diphosphate kinase regulator n=1 Tax=Bacteriovorax antarcticus TaxID=3088717 RepID=A0ABU5VTN4_9BACT|nr:nucleoside diphosphate kinase regulator [Bacteriovorax sp. PP10]MEA9356413.1 nucleoside diphosphate kinase regulator [Bacteriovorax sp. PP10]